MRLFRLRVCFNHNYCVRLRIYIKYMAWLAPQPPLSPELVLCPPLSSTILRLIAPRLQFYCRIISCTVWYNVNVREDTNHLPIIINYHRVKCRVLVWGESHGPTQPVSYLSSHYELQYETKNSLFSAASKPLCSCKWSRITCAKMEDENQWVSWML